MSDSIAILGSAILGSAVAGASDMPDSSRDRFTWEGHCWELVTDPDLDTALVRPGGSAIAQEAFAARLANILKLNVGNLIVTEGATINEAVISKLWVDGLMAKAITSNSLIVTGEAILNHATLIGQTVVDDINVQGKLIGTNGVFTGTVDFANVNVTGQQIVNKLAANSIEANVIKGGDFEGKTFTGGVFAGSVVRGGSIATSQYPSRDGGVHIAASTGLRGWDSSGTQTFQLDPNTGSVSISARLYATNSQNRGVILIPTTSAGGGGLWFTDDGTGSSNAASIWRSNYDPNSAEPLNIRGANGGHVNVQGGLQVTRGGVTSEYGISILNRGQDFYTEGGLTVRRPGSTSASANTVIESNGAVRLRSSSRRYKKNIVNWSPDAERVLALRPRQWQHDDPSRPDIIDERWHVGFVAEEVHDLGLKGLVAYSGDGAGGWRPESLNYERFAAAQQIVLQKHEAEIQDLRADNIELRERIALLEAQNGTP